MKVGGRMFRKALETEVFKMEEGGLMTNTTSEQLGWVSAPPRFHVQLFIIYVIFSVLRCAVLCCAVAVAVAVAVLLCHFHDISSIIFSFLL